MRLLRTDSGTYINMDCITLISTVYYNASWRVEATGAEFNWLIKQGFESQEEAREWLDKVLMYPTTLKVVEI